MRNKFWGLFKYCNHNNGQIGCEWIFFCTKCNSENIFQTNLVTVNPSELFFSVGTGGEFSLGASEIFTAEFSHFLMTKFFDFLGPTPKHSHSFFVCRALKSLVLGDSPTGRWVQSLEKKYPCPSPPPNLTVVDGNNKVGCKRAFLFWSSFWCWNQTQQKEKMFGLSSTEEKKNKKWPPSHGHLFFYRAGGRKKQISISLFAHEWDNINRISTNHQLHYSIIIIKIFLSIL